MKLNEEQKKNREERILMSGIVPEERDIILRLLLEFENPVYGEIGILFGGTIYNVLKHCKKHNKDVKVYGFDLFEDLLLEEEKFTVGWPHRTQTHNMLGNGTFGVNVAYEYEIENALKEKGFDNFTLIKGNSSDTIPKVDEIFDVVFIDGNHTYKQTMLDFEAFYEKSKIGTYFIFHDTLKWQADKDYKDGGPWKVCNELRSDNSLKYTGHYNRSAVFKRIE